MTITEELDSLTESVTFPGGAEGAEKHTVENQKAGHFPILLTLGRCKLQNCWGGSIQHSKNKTKTTASRSQDRHRVCRAC